VDDVTYDEIKMADKKLVERWLRSQPYSPDTANGYRRMLGYLLPWLYERGIAFETMTPEDLGEFIDLQNWSLSTKNILLYAARGFARYVVGPEHAAFQIRLPKPRARPQRTLSLEETKTLLAALRMDTPFGVRNKAIYFLFLDTGLRSSELASLDLADLDFEGLRLVAKVKGGNWEAAVFSEDTARVLAAWLQIRERYAGETEALFVGIGGSTPGSRMTRYGLRTNMRRLSKRAGIKLASPHALRRTMATLAMTQNRASDRIVSVMGRWRSTEQVRRYTAGLEVEQVRPFLVTTALSEHISVMEKRPMGLIPGDEKGD